MERILRGVKPADMSSEQPTNFVAKALGLNIPEVFLLGAAEVVE